MDVQGSEPVRPSGRPEPSPDLVPDRVVPEQAAVVGSDPDRPVVRVLAQAADDILFVRTGQVRQGHRLELANVGCYIIDSAIIGSDPESPFMVPGDGIDELVREGGRVLPVVPVQDLLSGQGLHFQQAVVGSDQEIPGAVVGDGMDVMESVPGRDGEVDRPRGESRPVDSAVPGP